MNTVVMPKLTDSMEQGTIIAWLKATGDLVETGDELLEIETDKATAPHVADSAGVLEILIPAGTTVAVGDAIARIATTAGPARISAISAISEHSSNGSAQPTDIRAARVEDRTPRATPLARRVAAVHDVALDRVRGSGPLGRVTRADVLRHAGLDVPAAAQRSLPVAATSTAAGTTTAGSTVTISGIGARRQQTTRLQQVVAQRMADAKATIPHFQVQTEVNVGAAFALRADLRSIAGDADAVPSINDLIIKAAANSLRRHPLANGSYRDGAFELHDAINVGFAVASDQSLVVPTVFGADTKSLGQIAAETRRLATCVRDGTIAPAELAGATFTVSNLGMFGMTAITPVINPPQAAILGVGAARTVLARAGEEIIEQQLLTVTLSCDHRILYGADAARFLADIRDLLEAPLRLAL